MPTGEPGTYWCDPRGQYKPDFTPERFKLPYAYASFRPVISDVRAASADPTAPSVVSVPVFGYGQDVAITYSYSGELAAVSRPSQSDSAAQLRARLRARPCRPLPLLLTAPRAVLCSATQTWRQGSSERRAPSRRPGCPLASAFSA